MYNEHTKKMLLSVHEIKAGMVVRIVEPGGGKFTRDKQCVVRSVAWTTEWCGLTVITFNAIVEGEEEVKQVYASHVYLDPVG